MVDDEKNNLIHICAKEGHVELFKYLLDKGVQVDAKNSRGLTPFDLTTNEQISSILKRYHKVTIYTSNEKSVNHLLNPMNNSLSINKKYIESITTNNTSGKNSVDTSGTNPATVRKTSCTTQNIPNLRLTHNYQDKNFSNVNSKNQGLTLLTSRNVDTFEQPMNMTINEAYGHLNKNLKTSDISNSNNEDYESNSENGSSSTPYSLDDEKIGPGHFVGIGKLGSGSFGDVYLVEKKSNKTRYAMKILEKSRILCKIY